MGFVLFIHIVSCVLLVIAILMQAGRGGGLAESFASAESMFGTQTNAFMVRATSVVAAVFLVTSLVLAMHGSKGERSIMSNKTLLPKTAPAAKPADDQPEISIKVEPPKAMELPAGADVPDVLDSAPAAEPTGLPVPAPAVNAAQ